LRSKLMELVPSDDPIAKIDPEELTEGHEKSEK
jgi:hypothetical protein